MMKLRSRYPNNTFLLCCILCAILGVIPCNIKVRGNIPAMPAPKESHVYTEIESGLGFVVDSLLRLQDQNGQLASFFNSLRELKAGRDTVLTILHLGDSHVQSGHYSGRVMRLLQQEFGNAGRGWISPFKLSRTNEPDDYFINSAAKEWTAGRIIQRKKKAPVGPGGIGISSVSPSINFDIIIAPNNGAGYEFNEVVLYRGDKSIPMLPAGTMKDSVNTTRSPEALAPRLVTDTFKITKLTDTLQLHSTRRRQGTNTLIPASEFSSVYYGFNLMNGKSGVLYHSVGINGAMYVNYTDVDFMQRVALLSPDLLVVSLGTNESFGARFREQEFRDQIHDFLRMVKTYIPNAAIILTTPAECYKRVRVNKQLTYVRNENTQRAAASIVRQAELEQIACLDLFVATGGKNSCKDWYQGGYLGRDRIHFTKAGYQKQGDLFYIALIRSLINDEKNTGVELGNNYGKSD